MLAKYANIHITQKVACKKQCLHAEFWFIFITPLFNILPYQQEQLPLSCVTSLHANEHGFYAIVPGSLNSANTPFSFTIFSYSLRRIE